MTLGQRIQELRKQHNLSQEALGEKLGVSRQAISRWEMDGAVPEIDKLIAMGKLFGVSLNDLLQVETGRRTGAQNRSGPAPPVAGGGGGAGPVDPSVSGHYHLSGLAACRGGATAGYAQDWAHRTGPQRPPGRGFWLGYSGALSAGRVPLSLPTGGRFGGYVSLHPYLRQLYQNLFRRQNGNRTFYRLPLCPGSGPFLYHFCRHFRRTARICPKFGKRRRCVRIQFFL